jgi:hypothetical protein
MKGLTVSPYNGRIQPGLGVVLFSAVRWIATLLFGGVLWMGAVPTPANAQSPSCEPLPVESMRAGLDQIEAALRRSAQTKALTAITRMFEAMPCLTSRATPRDLARFGRLRCETSFWDQDEELAIQWCTFSKTIENLPWPSRMAEGHPIRNLIEELEEPPIVGPDNKSLAVPKGGAALLDGRPTHLPKAMTETPHFVQLIDKKETVLSSTWVDGGAFGSNVLGESMSATPSLPKWLPAIPAAPSWDAAQISLSPADEKKIEEDRSNDVVPEDETEDEEYTPDIPIIHETHVYVAPPESAFGRLSVRVISHKQKPVRTDIIVDGTHMGQTPWEGELPAGAHYIEVSGIARDLVIQNGMLTETTVSLPAPVGKDKAAKEPKVKPVKEPKVKPVKEPKVKPVKEPKPELVKVPEAKRNGSKLAMPMLIAGGSTTVLGAAGIAGSFLAAQKLEWNTPKNQLKGLQTLNGVSWGLTGLGLAVTGFGLFELSQGATVGVTGGPKSILFYGRW